MVIGWERNISLGITKQNFVVSLVVILSLTVNPKKIRELKGSTDYRPASNSYPVKTLQRDVND